MKSVSQQLLTAIFLLLLVGCGKLESGVDGNPSGGPAQLQNYYGSGLGEPGYGICQESNPLRRCPLHSLGKYPWVVDFVGENANLASTLYCENRRALSAQYQLALQTGSCFWRWRSIGLDYGQQINPRCNVVCIHNGQEVTGDTIVRLTQDKCQALDNRLINLRHRWDIAASPMRYITSDEELRRLVAETEKAFAEQCSFLNYQ